MARQQVNHNFASRMARSSCAVIPVITPQGNIKQLRVTPSTIPEHWLVCEWITDGKRKVALKSVDLTSERAKAGTVFLRDAYIEEGWPEGWEAYEEYLRACYERTATDKEGNVRAYLTVRPREDIHFPDELLPKLVDAYKAKLERKPGDAVWRPSKVPKRPKKA